uniref:Uncharacterized protein n=1 Tax=Acidiphilium symbioticum TaxID=94005 RepID=Q9REI2_9PROT|nr:hypothetical protein [Acidiphilium symbioticum]
MGSQIRTRAARGG